MTTSSELDERESTLGPPRSRKAFRFMPSAVLWHNLPTVVQVDAREPLGRNIYARKLREHSDPPPDEAPRALLRWQAPLAYLIVASRTGWLLTWHAPWCRTCDCVGAGWRFSFARGYCSGFGFELSFPVS